MGYKIEIDFTEVYELIISISAYIGKKYHKNMDLGNKWIKEVSNKLTPQFNRQLKSLNLEYINILFPLIYHCPRDRNITTFLKWIKQLTLEEVNNILVDYMREMPINLKDILIQYADVLNEWNIQYFCKIDTNIKDTLIEDAKQKLANQKHVEAEDLFEKATNGMKHAADESISVIRLVPQYHLSPINCSYYYEKMFICFYTCAPLPKQPNEPPIQLMRITKCLADETRVKLLYLISIEERSFTDLVNLSGLSKSTVHHHLVALRGAGLIYLKISGRNNYYSIRTEGFKVLHSDLNNFLDLK